MSKIRVISVEKSTHDVMHITTEKPDGLDFKPGQAADVSIDKPEWKDEVRPFTFTSLPSDTNLEFNIKVYPEHNGVTEQIGKLKVGDHLILGDVFGAIEYKGEGVFLAGGAGVTPFIAIIKDLNKQGKIAHNKLIFANKKKEDIILHDYFQKVLGEDFVNTLSDEKVSGYYHGYITKELISQKSEGKSPYYYVCGPPPMMDAVMKQLEELGVSKAHIVHEDME